MRSPAESLTSALQDRYVLERELGRGGMATVYLAHDRRHERAVAFKVLHPEFTAALGPERFLREIKLAARLHHPHLLPVYDSGEANGLLYYVVPYIEGGSLRDRLRAEGRLPLGLSLRLVREAADGLDCAHRHGVVHRDVKPENILLEEQHAIVADFGVGRAVDAAADPHLTQTGFLVGTPIYMSPEQASGEPVDGRSDIYSLGCVLYELLVGKPPFTGASALAVLAQRFSNPPPSLQAAGVTVPAEVEDAVARALAERPEDRFSTSAEFAEVLAAAEASISRPALTPTGVRRPIRTVTLAVLPFVNMSPDPENEYFSEGITEELINAFTKVGGLQVASRTSAFSFKGKDLDVREIGRKLNVTSVLEGSVRRAGSRLRLRAQLVDATSGYHLWSETYDRQLSDVFEVQDELSRAIVSTLKVKLVGPEDTPLVEPPTKSIEAYNLYLQGRYFWNKRTPDALRKGIDYFEQAIQADPGYALAYSGLADSYHMLAVYGVLPPREAYPKAKTAAQKALELNDQLAEVHVSVAYVALCYDWDWDAAERELRRAIELNSSHAPAYHWLAWHLIIVGRKDEAAAAARQAIALEPLSPVIHARAGHILAYAGYPEESAAASLRALELDPSFVAAFESLAIAYTRPELRKYDEAITVLKQAMVSPASSARYFLLFVYAQKGEREETLRLFRDLQLDLAAGRILLGYGGTFVVGAYAALGDVDEAFRWLERLYEERVFTILLLKADQAFDPIRSDPRFDELLRKVGLVPVAHGRAE